MSVWWFHSLDEMGPFLWLFGFVILTMPSFLFSQKRNSTPTLHTFPDGSKPWCPYVRTNIAGMFGVSQKMMEIFGVPFQPINYHKTISFSLVSTNHLDWFHPPFLVFHIYFNPHFPPAGSISMSFLRWSSSSRTSKPFCWATRAGSRAPWATASSLKPPRRTWSATCSWTPCRRRGDGDGRTKNDDGRWRDGLLQVNGVSKSCGWFGYYIFG